MDLRVKKTRKAIFKAYLELRNESEPEKIKVIDICEKAEINKSTFYKHYRDVFDLDRTLKEEMFNEFWDNFAEKDLMLAEPDKFIIELPKAVDELGNAVLLSLFREDYDGFFGMLENRLIDFYVDPSEGHKICLKKTFIICGIIHVLKEQKRSRCTNNCEVADEICSIIREQGF